MPNKTILFSLCQDESCSIQDAYLIPILICSLILASSRSSFTVKILFPPFNLFFWVPTFGFSSETVKEPIIIHFFC